MQFEIRFDAQDCIDERENRKNYLVDAPECTDDSNGSCDNGKENQKLWKLYVRSIREGRKQLIHSIAEDKRLLLFNVWLILMLIESLSDKLRTSFLDWVGVGRYIFTRESGGDANNKCAKLVESGAFTGNATGTP